MTEQYSVAGSRFSTVPVIRCNFQDMVQRGNKRSILSEGLSQGTHIHVSQKITRHEFEFLPSISVAVMTKPFFFSPA